MGGYIRFGGGHSAETDARRKLVARDLGAGLTISDIADKRGASPSTIAQDVRVILQKWKDLQGKDAKDAILLHSYRYDQMLQAVWTLAVGTTPSVNSDGSVEKARSPSLDALKEARAIMKDQQTLLGLRSDDTPNSAIYKNLVAALRKSGFDPDEELEKIIVGLNAKTKAKKR